MPLKLVMKLFAKISLFLTLLSTLWLSGCIKEEQYPLEPHIDFLGFGTLPGTDGLDSIAQLNISYTDGDGNIGLYEKDSIEPYKYNYYIKLQQLINNVLVVDTLSEFNNRIPILTPTNRNKNIRGTITTNLDMYITRNFLKSDTIAFQMYLLDRDLNKSNVLQTPMYLIAR